MDWKPFVIPKRVPARPAEFHINPLVVSSADAGGLAELAPVRSDD
jgi:hypothetical protein